METLKIEGHSPEEKAEKNNLDEARECAKKKITLSSHNMAEISQEIKGQFGLSLIDAANLTSSIRSNLRINRAKELLKTNDRDTAIQQLTKELGAEEKLTRKKAKEYEKIAAVIVDKAIKAGEKK